MQQEAVIPSLSEALTNAYVTKMYEGKIWNVELNGKGQFPIIQVRQKDAKTEFEAIELALIMYKNIEI